MVRQDGTVSVHYDASGDGSACYRGRLVTNDPTQVSCGRCMRRPEWLRAYREAKQAMRR